ncbi:unknown [Eubacterium sp. CAG:786]|nr:unknown [Eubacterium sp. CAG:786]
MDNQLIERDIVVEHVEVAAVEGNVLEVINVRQSVVVCRASNECEAALVDHLIACDKVVYRLLTGSVPGRVCSEIAVQHGSTTCNGNSLHALLGIAGDHLAVNLLEVCGRKNVPAVSCVVGSTERQFVNALCRVSLCNCYRGSTGLGVAVAAALVVHHVNAGGEENAVRFAVALEFLELVLAAERAGIVNGIGDPACDAGAVEVLIAEDYLRYAVIVQLLEYLLGLLVGRSCCFEVYRETKDRLLLDGAAVNVEVKRSFFLVVPGEPLFFDQVLLIALCNVNIAYVILDDRIIAYCQAVLRNSFLLISVQRLCVRSTHVVGVGRSHLEVEPCGVVACGLLTGYSRVCGRIGCALSYDLQQSVVLSYDTHNRQVSLLGLGRSHILALCKIPAVDPLGVSVGVALAVVEVDHRSGTVRCDDVSVLGSACGAEILQQVHINDGTRALYYVLGVVELCLKDLVNCDGRLDVVAVQCNVIGDLDALGLEFILSTEAVLDHCYGNIAVCEGTQRCGRRIRVSYLDRIDDQGRLQVRFLGFVSLGVVVCIIGIAPPDVLFVCRAECKQTGFSVYKQFELIVGSGNLALCENVFFIDRCLFLLIAGGVGAFCLTGALGFFSCLGAAGLTSTCFRCHACILRPCNALACRKHHACAQHTDKYFLADL